MAITNYGEPEVYDPYDFALPGKVVSIKAPYAKVDFGGGTIREANITFVKAKVGDIVLVHAGYAIQVLDEEEARKLLERWGKEED